LRHYTLQKTPSPYILGTISHRLGLQSQSDERIFNFSTVRRFLSSDENGINSLHFVLSCLDSEMLVENVYIPGKYGVVFIDTAVLRAGCTRKPRIVVLPKSYIASSHRSSLQGGHRPCSWYGVDKFRTELQVILTELQVILENKAYRAVGMIVTGDFSVESSSLQYCKSHGAH
jgi:hypothetical protein